MCRNACKHIWDACDECVDQAWQDHAAQKEHEAVLAFVSASDDEWRRRLDEVCPLVTSLHFTQGTSNEQS